MWKNHVVYESRPHSVIVTLGRQMYKIPEVALPTKISLVSTKQCRKVISDTRKFFLFMILSQSEWEVMTTSKASTHGFSMKWKQVNKVVEEY
jgi:hypothetical protein